MSTYRVAVTAGAHTWNVTDDDPPGYGLADPLVVGWSVPDDIQRPGQPDVMVAQFAVIVPTAAALDVAINDLVTIAVTFGPVAKPAPDVAFVGRVAAGTVSPHRQGMLYAYTCNDLSADLQGFDIGAAPLFAQHIDTRVSALIANAGLPASDFVLDPAVSVGAGVRLYVEYVPEPDASPLFDALVETFDSVAYPAPAPLPAGSVFYRAIVAPAPCPAGQTSSLGIPWRWAIDALPDTYVPTAAAPLPGTFGPYFTPPTAYGIGYDPDDRGAGVFDACYIDYDSEWTAILPGVVNRAAVTWLLSTPTDTDLLARTPQVVYVVEDGPPPHHAPTTAARVTATVGLDEILIPGSQAAAIANARNLGHMMIPPPQNRSGWSPETFRWLLYADDAGLADFPTIFPAHYATGKPTPRPQRTACYVRPVVITGIPAGDNPADPTSDTVAGQLSAVELTIEAGRPTVELTLYPTIPASTDTGAATNTWNVTPGTWDAQAGVWDDLEPGYPSFRWTDPGLAGVTWNQIHPQPWNIYRLARGTG